MKKLGAALLAGVLAAMVLGSIPVAAAYPTGPDANQAVNWNNQFPHPATCFKHEAGDDSEHGTFSEDGETYTLAVFNQDWVGDHWEAIIVKAGSDESVDNPNLVTVHPLAGFPYPAPDGKDISHVIVCKGTTPDETPVPTPVVTPVPTPVVTPVPTPVVTPVPTPPVVGIQVLAVPCPADIPAGTTVPSRLRIIALVLIGLHIRIDGLEVEPDEDGEVEVTPGLRHVQVRAADDETVLFEGDVLCPTCSAAAASGSVLAETSPPVPPTDTDTPTSTPASGSLLLLLATLAVLGSAMVLATRKRL